MVATNIMRGILEEKITAHGGWVNAHSHIDRWFTVTPDKVALAQTATFEEKWHLNNDLKRTSSVADYLARMRRAVEHMLAQNTRVIGTFIDVDEVVGDKTMQAAELLRAEFKGQCELVFMNQGHYGALQPEAQRWFQRGAAFVDIIGGLPGADKPHLAEHLDMVLQTAKRLGKRAHVHVDQSNSPLEKETELLADKTIEHGMQGRVTAVHSISLAAHPLAYRRRVYDKMIAAGVSVIASPIAWIDHRRSEELMPFHSSVTPVDELVPAGITVAIGPDNVEDIYKPFNDGDMYTELRVLLEACRLYDVDALAKIASVNGRMVLGLLDKTSASAAA